jgi:quercetin dioxygenase-like cupin family protein
VLEGEVTFLLEGAERVESRGSWVLVPGGLAHTFGNRSSETASLLVLHAPPLDAYFAELHELWHREVAPTTAEELELMSRYGMLPA